METGGSLLIYRSGGLALRPGEGEALGAAVDVDGVPGTEGAADEQLCRGVLDVAHEGALERSGAVGGVVTHLAEEGAALRRQDQVQVPFAHGAGPPLELRVD